VQQLAEEEPRALVLRVPEERIRLYRDGEVEIIRASIHTVGASTAFMRVLSLWAGSPVALERLTA
jgi:hypothetical protein